MAGLSSNFEPSFYKPSCVFPSPPFDSPLSSKLLVRSNGIELNNSILPILYIKVHWYDSAIKPRICKVLEKNFWGGSIIKWVILYPKHRTSGCHVIGSRDNHVSKFEVPKNVGSFFLYLHWFFPDFLSIDEFSIV